MEITVNRSFTVEEKIELKPELEAALYRLYQLIWTEARYDPNTEDTRAFAEQLLPHIKLLNAEWKFKK